jgi:membrane protein DedA with SNARE-associated domain
MVASIFLLMIPESACLPVPSEVTLMGAGFGVHQGAISFGVAIGAATAGNLVGSLIAYAAGRRAPMPAGIARRCDALFERFGLNAVFVGRLLPLARSFISLPAGRARIPIAPFVALTVAGCAISSVAFVAAGIFAGAAWHAVAGTVGHVLLATGVLAMLWMLMRRPLRD